MVLKHYCGLAMRAPDIEIRQPVYSLSKIYLADVTDSGNERSAVVSQCFKKHVCSRCPAVGAPYGLFHEVKGANS
jgi:hypothetical protein